MSTPARATVHVDNEHVRVTEWRFAPGAATGRHRHQYPYVVVPLTTGYLEMIEPGGALGAASLDAGRPYYRAGGVEHDVRNANAFDFAFVEIEVKAAVSPGAARRTPASARGPAGRSARGRRRARRS